MEKKGKHPHSGRQKMQEGMQGLGEEEDRGTQAGLVELQVRDPLEVWVGEWGTLRCLVSEEEGQAGSGVRR